jgi:hypothetical protein
MVYAPRSHALFFVQPYCFVVSPHRHKITHKPWSITTIITPPLASSPSPSLSPATLVTPSPPLLPPSPSLATNAIAFFVAVGINLVALDLTFFVAIPIALAALAIAPLPPLPSPFTITLFVARHLVAIAFAHIFEVTIARWQQ